MGGFDKIRGTKVLPLSYTVSKYLGGGNIFSVMYRENGEACGVRGEDGLSVVWGESIPRGEAEDFVATLGTDLNAADLEERVLSFLVERG